MTTIDAYAAGASAVSDYSAYGLLVAQSNQTKSRLNTLSEQASTGLVSTVFSGLGGSARTALDLRAQVTGQQAQINAISSADGRITLTQSVLGQISSIASSFYASTLSLANPSDGTVANLAASARSSLQILAGLLNTQDGQSYIFAGSDTGTPPVPDAANIGSSTFYTAINGAVQSLATNGAAATIAATLSTASSNAAGLSPFSAALSQPPSSVNAGLRQVEVGDGTRVTIGIAASANASAISAGTSTTGSYIRDLLRSLATIGSLSDSQAGTDAYNALLTDTRTSLNNTVGAISDEQGILGNTQNRIDAASTLLTATNTALNSQISNVQDVDVASVATQLTQTQANLQASYKLIASVSDDSLLKYL